MKGEENMHHCKILPPIVHPTKCCEHHTFSIQLFLTFIRSIQLAWIINIMSMFITFRIVTQITILSLSIISIAENLVVKDFRKQLIKKRGFKVASLFIVYPILTI